MSVLGYFLFYGAVTACSILLVIVAYFYHTYNYWRRKGVPSLSPFIPWGDFGPLLLGSQCMAEISRDLYCQLKKSGHKHGGLYFINAPVYMPTDQQFVKNIISTDFESFSERGTYYNELKDPLSAHLFNLPSGSWKALRAKLTPTFSSAKIKYMFQTMVSCGRGLVSACDGAAGRPLDINDFTVRFIVDVIGSCAFGVECNSLLEPSCQFRRVAEQLINPPAWNGIKTFLSLVCSNLCKLANLSLLQEEIKQFFIDFVDETIRYRENHGVSGNDFLQLLINIKKKDMSDENCALPMTNLRAAAQCFVFFAAGFETSSFTATMCLFELSQNPELQETVRREIRDALNKDGGELTYEGLMSMSCLHRCVLETMRKYPPLGFLNRVCTKRYRIPETDVILEEGTAVLVSLLGLHNDPDHYPDPERFDPDRFSDENKSARPAFTYMPFGEGRRSCIGARFGSVQTKVCLAMLLHNFRFSLNARTKLPISYKFTSFVLSTKKPILLDVVRLSH